MNNNRSGTRYIGLGAALGAGKIFVAGLEQPEGPLRTKLEQ